MTSRGQCPRGGGGGACEKSCIRACITDYNYKNLAIDLGGAYRPTSYS